MSNKFDLWVPCEQLYYDFDTGKYFWMAQPMIVRKGVVFPKKTKVKANAVIGRPKKKVSTVNC
jgi:hypothetical protein